MDLKTAIQNRHSVRKFKDTKIEESIVQDLSRYIAGINQQSGLAIRLCIDEPRAFSGAVARYGRFENVSNYIAIIGQKGEENEEKAGYYGQKIVLHAQTLGLNTCWVALTFSKSKSRRYLELQKDEKLILVIALGYGQTQGSARPSKPLQSLYRTQEELPKWFKDGVKAASLAPTAINQQRFVFHLTENRVRAVSVGLGFYTKVDLGIVKYHFEIGAGDTGWRWADE